VRSVSKYLEDSPFDKQRFGSGFCQKPVLHVAMWQLPNVLPTLRRRLKESEEQRHTNGNVLFLSFRRSRAHFEPVVQRA